MRDINILFSSAGRRVELINSFRKAKENMNNETFLRLLLKNGNSHLELKTDTKFFKNLITFITDIDFILTRLLLSVAELSW